MVAEKSKPQPVDFQIRSIQLMESFLAEPVDHSKPISDFSFDIRTELKINDEHQWFMIITDIKVRKKDQDDVLGKVKTQCVYHIDQFADITAKGSDGKIKIPKQLTDTLNSISLSTTRGIMFSAFRGTYLHHAVLPVIDPTKLNEGDS